MNTLCRNLLTAFVDANRLSLVSRIESIQSLLYTTYYNLVRQVDAHTEESVDRKTWEDLRVSADVIDVAAVLDHYAMFCAMVLGEQPPMPKAAGVDRDLIRRANMRQSIVASSYNQSLTLQLDIDRLFSQKVIIFDTIQSTSSMDTLVNALLKDMLKTILECLRIGTFPMQGYVQIQANVSFLKQVSPIGDY